MLTFLYAPTWVNAAITLIIFAVLFIITFNAWVDFKVLQTSSGFEQDKKYQSKVVLFWGISTVVFIILGYLTPLFAIGVWLYSALKEAFLESQK